MTVNITISGTSTGSSLSDSESLDQVSPGNDTDYQDLYISHDATVSSITDCALYITRSTSLTYPGLDADADLVELLGWGDAATGGVTFVMDGWGSWISGENTTGTWLVCKNGYGDVDAQIELVKESITLGTPPANDGEIPVGGEAHLQVKVSIPAATSAGYRGFGFVMAYSATS